MLLVVALEGCGATPLEDNQ